MTESLNSWPRQHYVPGGADPLLHYGVYGQFSGGLNVSRSRHHTNGPPEGLNISQLDRESNPGVLEEFYADHFGVLLSEQKDLEAAVHAAPQCLVLMGGISDPDSLDYLRDTIGMITAMLESGGVGVYDPLQIRWWTAEDWKKIVFDPGSTPSEAQVVILTTPEEESERDGKTWIHTRGVRKFGRPDLSVRGVPADARKDAIGVVNRFVDMQIQGAIIPEGQAIRMAGIPDGMTCHHAGDVDDPDFNNVHVEIRWPGQGDQVNCPVNRWPDPFWPLRRRDAWRGRPG